MEKGKRICQVLKELRKRIADANEIPFEIKECTHKGECSGTCPKCEAEVYYLTESINQRGWEGKPVVLYGLMNEAELRQALGIDPIEQECPQTPDDSALLGMPAPPRDLEGLMVDEAYPLCYNFVSIIAKGLLAKTDGNIVFSPVGLCRVLEMLQTGMNENSPIYEKVSDLIGRFNSDIETVDEDSFKLEHASSIWYNKSLGTIHKDYLDELENDYDAEAHHADFTQKKFTKLMIDKWVFDNTHQMIKTLDTEINQDVLILVLDAISMKGKWENPFDPDYTDLDTFHNANGSEAVVYMMYQNIEEAAYNETDDYQLIHLPYRNNAYSMVLILPKEGVAIESIIGRADWTRQNTEVCEVDLYMPRFNFDNTLSYKEILTDLGLGDMFDKEDSFPNITDEPVHITQIKQQCVINLEEEGTEAAALTIAECAPGCSLPDDFPEPVTMRLDRPFVFAIKGEYNQFLFIGILKQM
ncbi:MAG: serpin family protein [Bacteroides sp.]